MVKSEALTRFPKGSYQHPDGTQARGETGFAERFWRLSEGKGEIEMPSFR